MTGRPAGSEDGTDYANQYEGDMSTAELADVLRLPAGGLVDVIGGGWRRADDIMQAQDLTVREWYVSGDPEQVLMGVDGCVVVLARPVGTWHGHRCGITPEDSVTFSSAELVSNSEVVRATIHGITAASRRRIRWCRTCRSSFSPWHMDASGECHGCMAEHRGVTF